MRRIVTIAAVLVLWLSGCAQPIEAVQMVGDESGKIIIMQAQSAEGQWLTLYACDCVDYVKVKPKGGPERTFVGR